MSILKWLGLVAAGVTLAGCGSIGNISYAPAPAGVPMAWDGNGTPPADETRPVRRTRRATAQIVSAPIDPVAAAPANPADAYARQQADDRVAEATLKKQMMICRDCLPGETGELTTGSISASPAGTVASKQ